MKSWMERERHPLLQSFNVNQEDAAKGWAVAIVRMFVKEPYDKTELAKLIAEDDAYIQVHDSDVAAFHTARGCCCCAHNDGIVAALRLECNRCERRAVSCGARCDSLQHTLVVTQGCQVAFFREPSSVRGFMMPDYGLDGDEPYK